MIRSFADKETERLWNGERVRKLPADVQRRARDKLRLLHRARSIDDLRNPPSNRLHPLERDRAGKHSIFPSTCNGVYASSGATEALMVSKSRTITNPAWIHNSHAGELVISEFMDPLGLAAETLAAAIDMPVEAVRAVLHGDEPMSAELDLRLGRYFRMSEGFFLALQDDYELLEAKRALNGELERIQPRAA